MSNVLGVGIIGAGTVFEQHALAYGQLAGRARLLAIAEIDEARLRAATSRHFIPFATTDHRALLDRREIDIVTVCTPPSSHETFVVDALRAGKYVVCEKPLAHTLEAADRIIEVSRRFPGRLSTVHQFRYLPEVRNTVWLRDQGHLGPLLFGRFSRYARNDASVKPARPGKARKPGKVRAVWWGRWDVAGGGAVMTQLIHELDLMCHIFGPPVEVSAVMDTLKEPIESEDTCAATVRFASGAVACCYGTVAAQRSTHGFDVIGQSASVHLPWSLECADPARRKQVLGAVRAAFAFAAAPSSLASRLRRTWRDAVAALGRKPGKEPAASAHAPYLSDVLDAIEAGEALPVGPEEARASLELCVGIYSSALSGRPITLPIGKTNRYYGGITTKDYDGRDRKPASAGIDASTGQRTGT
jgi:predicted dehydrogenase